MCEMPKPSRAIRGVKNTWNVSANGQNGEVFEMLVRREVPEDPKKKHFYVWKDSSVKKHIATRKKLTGDFKSLCGLKFPAAMSFAETTKVFNEETCGRCQRCSSKKVYECGGTYKRVIRIARLMGYARSRYRSDGA
jgi:hypothetical protein